MEVKTKEFFKLLRGLIVKHYEDTNVDKTIEQYWEDKKTEHNLSEMLDYFEALEKEVEHLRFKVAYSESKRLSLESGYRVLQQHKEALTERLRKKTFKTK
jgi:hypothetical protein